MLPNEPRNSFSFKLGVASGWVIAPIFALTSFARRGRTFHPRGPVFHAVLKPRADSPLELQNLAEQLAGPALVRFSAALWKHAQWIPDVLGCAIRLRSEATDSALPAENDQDLLFATIRRPWSMPFAPLTTNVQDYLGNDYFSVSPFGTGQPRPIYLRLHPVHSSLPDDPRRTLRIAHEAKRGGAVLRLGCSERPLGPWTDFLDVSLQRPANVDGEALRFSPFRAGRGLQPSGFVHALRAGVYALSQRARPHHSP